MNLGAPAGVGLHGPDLVGENMRKTWVFLGLLAAACGGGGGGRRSGGDGRYYEATVVRQGDLKPEHFKALAQQLPRMLDDTPVLIEDAQGRQTLTPAAKLRPAAQQALYIVLTSGDDNAQEFDLRVRMADDRRVPVTVRRAPGGGFIVREGAIGERLARGKGEGLQARYGIGPLAEQGAEWTPRAREVLDLTLDALDPTERKVLEGMPFIRRVRGDDPSHGALYHQTNCQAEIFLYDSALKSDTDQFVGEPESPLPTSTRTLLHEVGHALHQRPGRVAWCNLERRMKSINDRVAASNARGERFNRDQASLSGPDRKRELAAIEAEQKDIAADRKAFDRETAEARELVEGGPLLESYRKVLGKHSAVTRYGETSIKESFAESYSLYRADPAALKRLLPDVFAYFERGQHLSTR